MKDYTKIFALVVFCCLAGLQKDCFSAGRPNNNGCNRGDMPGDSGAVVPKLRRVLTKGTISQVAEDQAKRVVDGSTPAKGDGEIRETEEAVMPAQAPR